MDENQKDQNQVQPEQQQQQNENDNDDNDNDKFKTPNRLILSTPLNQSIHSASTTTPNVNYYSTPISKSNNLYSTPIQNSPFQFRLTPVVENKKLFGIDSSDVLPVANSSNVNKNVHSPPKPIITLVELRSICEQKFLNLTLDNINSIVNETKYKKKRLTNWFINEWFDNKDVNYNSVLRTVFSVFCFLRKNNKLVDNIASAFQLFWNKLKKEKSSSYKNRIVKKNIKNNDLIKNNNIDSNNIDHFFDISDSFMC